MRTRSAAGQSYELVIANGEVVLEDRVARAEIGIRDGRIAAIAPSVERGGARIVDAAGLVVMPGMIDAHVHLNEPGLGHWEGFVTGTNALAAGGCTAFIDMPLNGIPPTVTVDALERKRKRAAGAALIDYAFWGGLMPGYLGELPALAEAGVVGFKAFMSSPGDEDEDAFRRSDDGTLLEGMKRIAELGKILVLHAEDESIVARLTAIARAEGRQSAADYAATRPVEAETEAVGKALNYAKQTGCRLHFAHISSEAAVRMIGAARLAGVDVSLETCPHYLALTDEDLARLGAVAKCAPPLRGPQERAKLWQCLERGEIDLIASDHSPCPGELKQSSDLFAAWGGIAGAQSSLTLLVDEGHRKRGMPLSAISRLLAGAPAARFGLDGRKGAIKEGLDADLALIDLNRKYRLTAEQLQHRHKHTPYLDREIGCKVASTLLRGTIVYAEQDGIAPIRNGRELHAIGTRLE
ncbi:allantoinase AllB [Paenibacillus methanolicus]|uniref:Allantoinase n=1 Tax=Paenibacillus methanolicus TaxID=582686 RepID=A0A5S5C404_9BACL|nr:allantoinase AllB [Paenibacillus methanolicus]TYP73348.1 allantoinase [Paenibacillus methanolicus]